MSAPTVIPPDVAFTEDESTDTLMVMDDDTLAIVDENGEIVSLPDAPDNTAEAREIAYWVGERRGDAKSRLAGLEAEKAAWITLINDRYDSQIKKQKGLIAWIEARYSGILEHFLNQIINGKKQRSAVVGLLKMSLTPTRPKMEVIDKAAALDYLEHCCPDAVKVERSVLVSMIPDEMRAELTDETGLRFNPGGVPVFKIE